MDSQSIQQWTPAPNEQAWLQTDAGQVKVTVVDYKDGAGALVKRYDSDVTEHATLDKLSPVTEVKGEEAAELLKQITAAPEPADVPAFIKDKADLSINKQVEYLEAVADAIAQQTIDLAKSLTPFLNQGEIPGEADDAKHDQPALPDEASPLAERLNQAQGKLAQAYKQLRYTSRRLQP